MAGTGHSYEIANAMEVRDLLSEAGSGLEAGQGRDWFLSRKLVRYLTSERFTAKISPDQVEGTADTFDPEDRGRLVEKIENGGDVRMFSRQIFAAGGIDLAHLADWISWVSKNDPRLSRKLARITVDQAVIRADAWTASISSLTPGSRGQEHLFMETAAGQAWMSLDDRAALMAEGYAMSHCVGDYGERLEAGTSRLFSLRDASGRSLLTAEFVKADARNQLRQAYAFGNSATPPRAQGCLAELMDRLEAVDSPGAAAAGLCLVKGRWKRVIDAWERIEWQGHSGVARGRTLIVMSPRNPAAPLLKAEFSQDGWMESVLGQTVVVSALEERHFHIDEQRVFADLCTMVGTDAFFPKGFDLAEHDGRLRPVRDLWERRDFGGVECHVEKTRKGEVFHVTHSKDEARTLLRFGECGALYHDERHFPKHVTGRAAEAVRWNMREAQRCMTAMTAAGVTSMDTIDEAGKEVWHKLRPVRLPCGEWRLFKAEAETAPCLTAPGNGAWLRTAYRAELSGMSNQDVSVSRNADGKVSWVSAFLFDKGLAEEVAAFLNKEGWEPARHVHGLHEAHYGNGKYPRARLHFIGGSWMACTSLESFLEAALKRRAKRRKLVLSEAEAEGVLAMLPEERISGDGDRLLAAAVEAWAKTAKMHVRSDRMLETHGVMRLFSERWSSCWEGRLRVAARLMPLLGERARRQVGRIACLVAKEAMRGRSQYFDPRRDTLVRLVADFHDHLPDSLFQRALKRGLCHWQPLTGTSDHSPSPAWFGPILERAGRFGQTWLLVEAADVTSARLPKEDVCITLQDAGNWLDCYRLALRGRWHFHSSLSIGRFVDIAVKSASVDPDRHASWTAVISEAQAMKSAYGREKEETRAA